MCTTHKPVCFDCRMTMTKEASGYEVLDNAEFGPYRLTAGDLFQCPRCGIKIISDYADKSLNHYEPRFKSFLRNIVGSDFLIDLVN